jgi:hypothetical protein
MQYELVDMLLKGLRAKTGTIWKIESSQTSVPGRRVYRIQVDGVCIAAYKSALEGSELVALVQKIEVTGTVRDTSGNTDALSRVLDQKLPGVVRKRRMAQAISLQPYFHPVIPIASSLTEPEQVIVSIGGLSKTNFCMILLGETGSSHPPAAEGAGDGKNSFPRIYAVLGGHGGSTADSFKSPRVRMALEEAQKQLVAGTLLRHQSLMVPQFESAAWPNHMVRHTGALDLDTDFTGDQKERYISTILELAQRDEQAAVLGRKAVVLSDLMHAAPKVAELGEKVAAIAKALRASGVWCVAYWSGGKGFRLLIASKALFIYVPDNATFKDVVVGQLLPHFMRANGVHDYAPDIQDAAVHVRENGVRPDVLPRCYGKKTKVFPQLFVSPAGEAADEEAKAHPLFGATINPALLACITEFWRRIYAMAATLSPTAPLDCPRIAKRTRRKDGSEKVGPVRNTNLVKKMISTFEREMGVQKVANGVKPTHHLQTSQVNVYYDLRGKEDRMFAATLQRAEDILQHNERISQWPTCRFVVDIDKVDALHSQPGGKLSVLYAFHQKLVQVLQLPSGHLFDAKSAFDCVVMIRADRNDSMHLTYMNLCMSPATAKVLIAEIKAGLQHLGWQDNWIDHMPFSGGLRMPRCPKKDEATGGMLGPESAYLPMGLLDKNGQLLVFSTKCTCATPKQICEACCRLAPFENVDDRVRRLHRDTFNLYPRGKIDPSSPAAQVLRMGLALPEPANRAVYPVDDTPHFAAVRLRKQKYREEQERAQRAAAANTGWSNSNFPIVKCNGNGAETCKVVVARFIEEKKQTRYIDSTFAFSEALLYAARKMEPTAEYPNNGNRYSIGMRDCFCITAKRMHSPKTSKIFFIIDMDTGTCTQRCSSSNCTPSTNFRDANQFRFSCVRCAGE